MAPVPGKSSVLYVDKYNLSPYFNSADFSNSVAKLDTTTFGQSDHTYVPGLRDGMVKGSGFFDGSAGAVNEALSAMVGTDAAQPGSYGAGGDTLGSAAILWASRDTKYDIKSPVAGVVSIDGEFTADGGIGYGYWLHALGAETSTGSGTYIDLSTTSAAGWRACLHVTATAGASPSTVVIVEHSADHSVWATLVTFTAATAAVGQYLSSVATSTINRYIRASWTLGGSTTSITFAVSFSRR